MTLPVTDPRERLALRATRDLGGTVRVSASQRHLAKRLENKGLVTLAHLAPDGIEMTLTPDGKDIADMSEEEEQP